ncbi:hypothetical protein ACFPRL_27820 [Pseudoclavibacter helvolus]
MRGSPRRAHPQTRLHLTPPPRSRNAGIHGPRVRDRRGCRRGA